MILEYRHGRCRWMDGGGWTLMEEMVMVRDQKSEEANYFLRVKFGVLAAWHDAYKGMYWVFT